MRGNVGKLRLRTTAEMKKPHSPGQRLGLGINEVQVLVTQSSAVPHAHPSLSFMPAQANLLGVRVIAAWTVHGEKGKGMEYNASRYLHTLCAIP